MKKKELEPIAKQECAALKAIFMERRKALGLTQEKAAEALGMNQGSFSHYLNGRNSINTPFAVQVAHLLQVPVESFSPRIAKLIDMMTKAVSGEGLAEKHKGEREGSNVAPVPQPWRAPRKYPLISWIAAGERAESPDNFVPGDAEDYLASTENAGDKGYWLSVRGPSMTSASNPSFPEGTKILVRPEGFDLISGKFYIARHVDGEKTFKRLFIDSGISYLTPLNQTFKTVEVDGDWEIIGRVIDAKIPGL
ncbi:LexA family protein [Pseudomonas chlororaphis]|uniref:LexA family protein n=1 Tax=Pseudomonas chlororaphis TaxID=587753 RepID=UPI0024088CF9|nr:LexA family transcriptional regulator [Pseudomonas chlororaphis]